MKINNISKKYLIKGSFIKCLLIWSTLILSCSPKSIIHQVDAQDKSGIELVVLGIAQDAGFPQADCQKSCCKTAWADKSKRKLVSCLGLRDLSTNQLWLFDATPDFKEQLQLLKSITSLDASLDGIFLTHAHMGHYTGLMHLGREAMGTQKVTVYAKPRLRDFLSTSGPWSQLVALNNIDLRTLSNEPVFLTKELKVESFEVPHRDEFSETVGYKISGPNRSVLFIPDIDKWERWDEDIISLIKEVDYAFLDGTFYQNGEIWGRDMSQIPHPFVIESMEKFQNLSKADKAKIHFIHLNHTNPLLRKDGKEYDYTIEHGFKVAESMLKIGI